MHTNRATLFIATKPRHTDGCLRAEGGPFDGPGDVGVREIDLSSGEGGELKTNQTTPPIYGMSMWGGLLNFAQVVLH